MRGEVGVARGVFGLKAKSSPVEFLSLFQNSVHPHGFHGETGQVIGSRMLEDVAENFVRPELSSVLALQSGNTGDMIIVIVARDDDVYRLHGRHFH